MNYLPLTQVLEKDPELYVSYLSLLSQLTTTPFLTKECFMEQLSKISAMGCIMVCVEDHRIIGTATLILEPKLIRNGKCVGHIEDIVVDKSYRSMRVASTLLHALVKLAEPTCFKVILDCTEEVSGFYKKNGFVTHGVQMARYF